MSQTVRERHYRDRMESVRYLASGGEHDNGTMSWRDYEDLVGLCLELSESARDLFEEEYRRVFKDMNATVVALQEKRQVLEELSGAFVQLAESIRKSAHEAWQASGCAGGQDFLSRLDKAILAVVEMKDALLERWPVGSPSEIAAAKAAIARGEGLDADEAFAEIAGMSVAKWQQAVQEYKARRQPSAGG